MKKISLVLLGLSIVVLADFTHDEAEALAQKAAKIRQELQIDKKLTKEEQKIAEIREELDIPISLKENQSLKTNSLHSSQSLIPDDSSSIGDTLSSTLTSIKNSLTSEDEDDSSSLLKSIGLEEGEYLGLPSIFGLNKKEEDHTLFGSTILGGMQDTSSTFYKGFKHSGESAEFMSGMMYYNARVYNTMFGMFDASPFNIFEDEDDNSIFDIFEKGNDVMDIFD